MLYCIHCGSEVEEEQEICTHCGCYAKLRLKAIKENAIDTYVRQGLIFSVVGLVVPIFLIAGFACLIRGVHSKRYKKEAILSLISVIILIVFYIAAFLTFFIFKP